MVGMGDGGGEGWGGGVRGSAHAFRLTEQASRAWKAGGSRHLGRKTRPPPHPPQGSGVAVIHGKMIKLKPR